MNDSLVYTVKEASKMLHLSPNFIYQLIAKGYLPAIRLGSIKILRSSLEKFLEENEGKDFTDLDNIVKLTNIPIKEED